MFAFKPTIKDYLSRSRAGDGYSLLDTKNRSSTRNANIYQNLKKTHQGERTVRPKKEWKTAMCACLSSKVRNVRQLLCVFTHQLPGSEESRPVSLAGIQRLRAEAGVSG